MKPFITLLVLIFSTAALAAQDAKPPAPPTQDEPKAAAPAAPKPDPNAAAKLAALRAAYKELQPLGKLGDRALAKVRKGVKVPAALAIIRTFQKELSKYESKVADVTEETVLAKASAFADKACEFVVLGEGGVTASAESVTGAEGTEKDMLTKVNDQLYVHIVMQEINSYLPDGKLSGTFEGMFENVAKHGPKAAAAFQSVFTDFNQSENVRSLAGEGLAQTGGKDHVAEMKKIEGDELEVKSIREKAEEIVARLGDLTKFNAKVAKLDENIKEAKEKATKAMAAAKDVAEKAAKLNATANRTPEQEEELKKVQKESETTQNAVGNAALAIGGIYYERALEFQKIRDHAECANSFGSALGAWEPIMGFLQRDPNRRGMLQNTFYNLACSQSNLKKVDEATRSMEFAFKVGYSNYDWAMKDGDLKNLRASEKFMTLFEEVKSGKAKERWKKEHEEAQKKAAEKKAEGEKPVGEKPVG